MFRTVLFWFHLTCALAAGIVVAMMSFTGVVLTYELQLVERAERSLDVTPSAEAPRLSPEALLQAAATGGAEIFDSFEPTSITLRNDPAAAVKVQAGRTGKVYLDPYSGRVLGTGFPRLEGFFSSVRGWHRWFNLTGDSRSKGRAVTGAANLAFLFIVSSGLYLWLPRRWEWKNFRAVLLFKRGASGKARDFNWHNVVGIWTALPLVLIVFSGVVISYDWAGELVKAVVGEPAMAPTTATATATTTATPAPPTIVSETFEEAILSSQTPSVIASATSAAMARMPEWRTLSLSLPRESGDPMNLRLYAGFRGQSGRTGRMTVDPVSGEEISWTPYAELAPYSRARSFLRFAHTGEFWGLPGQTVAGLVTLSTLLLVWTGVALSLRRLSAYLTRRRRG